MHDNIKVEPFYPFKGDHPIREAANYYLNRNPARQTFINIAEPESSNTYRMPDFTGLSPRDIYASVTWAIENTLKGSTPNEYWVFVYKYLTPEQVDSSDPTVSRLIFPGMQNCETNRESARRRVCQLRHKMEDKLLRILAKRHLINPGRLQDLLNSPDKHIN